MADMTTLRAQLDKLKEARASAVRTIDIGGRSVTYRSDAEIAAAIAAVRAELAALEGREQPAGVVVRHMKGW